MPTVAQETSARPAALGSPTLLQMLPVGRELGGFSPTSLAGLVLWLAADRLTGFADGDPVGTWSDLSGQANHLTQATASKKPLWKAGIVNGRAVVRFDGVDDTLTATAFVGFASTTYTLFVVFSRSATGTQQTLVVLGADAGGQVASVTSANHLRNGKSGIANYAVGSSALSGSSTVYVVTAQDDASNGRVWVNGTLDGGPTASATTYTGGALWTGLRGTGGEPLPGDVAEIVAYNRALTTTQQRQAEQYLAQKYAVTVA